MAGKMFEGPIELGFLMGAIESRNANMLKYLYEKSEHVDHKDALFPSLGFSEMIAFDDIRKEIENGGKIYNDGNVLWLSPDISKKLLLNIPDRVDQFSDIVKYAIDHNSMVFYIRPSKFYGGEFVLGRASLFLNGISRNTLEDFLITKIEELGTVNNVNVDVVEYGDMNGVQVMVYKINCTLNRANDIVENLLKDSMNDVENEFIYRIMKTTEIFIPTKEPVINGDSMHVEGIGIVRFLLSVDESLMGDGLIIDDIPDYELYNFNDKKLIGKILTEMGYDDLESMLDEIDKNIMDYMPGANGDKPGVMKL